MVELGPIEEGYMDEDAAMEFARKESKKFKLYYVGERDNKYMIKEFILRTALANMYILLLRCPNRRWTEEEIKEELDKLLGVEILYYFEHKYDGDPNAKLAY